MLNHVKPLPLFFFACLLVLGNLLSFLKPPTWNIEHAIDVPRTLASVSNQILKQGTTIKKELASKEVYLNCDRKSRPIQVNAKHILMKLKNCDLKSENGPIAIKNKTNLFEATIFESTQEFFTDYVYLEKGSNLMELTSTNAGGEAVVHKFHIKRLNR